MNTVKWMNEWVNELWHTQIPMKVLSVQWASSFWGGGISTGPWLCSTSLQGVGSESKALPKPLRSRSWWWVRLDGKDWGFCGHGRHLESWKRDRATSQGRPKTKPSPIIICRVCCPRFVEDLPGLISSRETVMCVSNYSFKSKHYLYQRALRRLLRGL